MFKQLTLLAFLLFYLPYMVQAQNPCEPKPPVAICDETIVISLNDQNSVKLFAASIDDGSFAYTCGSDDILLSIARLDQCDGDCTENDFTASIDFNEDDIFKSFSVILKVTDELGKSNECMATVKVLDKWDQGDNENPIGESGGCTLVCLEGLTASLSNDGTAHIWPLDFLESLCSGEVKLNVYDEDNNLVFEQTTEDYWTADSEDVDQNYSYTITHTATDNTCWGNVMIVDKIGENGTEQHQEGEEGTEEATCPEFAIDFSSYSIETEIEFEGKSLAAVNQILSKTYADAHDDVIRANGIDPNSNNYLVAYSLEDNVFEKENGDLKIIRTITLIDWCNFDPSNGINGVKEVTQVILIKKLGSMTVASINYAEGSSNIPVNKILLSNESGQMTIPEFSADKSLTETINATLESVKWNQGNYKIEVDKYEACNKGISSIDIVQVMHHILGTKTFDTNAKIVAADFDENGKVSAADLVNMRKLVLGIDPCSHDSKWRFYKKSLKANKNFSLNELINHELSYEINNGTQEDIEIVALKKGDVNLSATDEKSFKSKNLLINTSDIALKSGEVSEIKLYATEDLEFISADFNVETKQNLEIVGFASGKLEIKDHNYNVGENNAKLVWYGEQSAIIPEGELVISMFVRSKTNERLSNAFDLSTTNIQLYPNIDSKTAINSQINITETKGSEYNSVSTYGVYMTDNLLNIESTTGNSDKILSVEIYNMAGQQLYSERNIGHTRFNVQLNTNGSQILNYRILSEKGAIQVGKVFSY